MNTIAERLKMVRLSRGLSQQEVADKINLSQSAYAKIEKGISRLDIDRFFDLCQLLDLSPGIVIDPDISNPADWEKKEEQQITAEAKTVSDKTEVIRQLRDEIRFLRTLLSRQSRNH